MKSNYYSIGISYSTFLGASTIGYFYFYFFFSLSLSLDLDLSFFFFFFLGESSKN